MWESPHLARGHHLKGLRLLTGHDKEDTQKGAQTIELTHMPKLQEVLP